MLDPDFLLIIKSAGDVLESFSPPIIGDIMTTQKGVARAATNIKSMSGSPSGAIATISVGGWVLGNYSPTKTDLIDITEYYRPSGEKIALAAPCKASVNFLTVTAYTVEPPPVDPSPVDPPTIPIVYEIIEQRRHSHDGGLSWTEFEFWGMNRLP